jgi:hypothetical protein
MLGFTTHTSETYGQNTNPIPLVDEAGLAASTRSARSTPKCVSHARIEVRLDSLVRTNKSSPKHGMQPDKQRVPTALSGKQRSGATTLIPNSVARVATKYVRKNQTLR